MPNPQRDWDPDGLLLHIPPEDTPGAVLLLDADGRVRAARGKRLEELLDPETAVVGEDIEALFGKWDASALLKRTHAEAIKGLSRSCRHRAGSMELGWELSPLDNARGREVLALAVALEPEQTTQNADLEECRRTDRVTGVPTRHALRLMASEAFERNPSSCWSVLRVRIRGLQRINHALGQDQGDVALTQAIERLRSSLGQDEMIGRVTGNEFVAVIHRDTQQETVDRLHAMAMLFEEPFSAGGMRFLLYLTIGVALFPEDGKQAGDLSRRASIAVERADTGGISYAFFNEAFEDALLANSWVPVELKRALRENELVLYYQPIIDALTGETAWLEALVRWQHPWRGMIPPDDFIPMAEQTAMMVDVDIWVLEQACHDAAKIGRPVAVNITAGTLSAPDFLARLDRALKRSKLPEGWLTLELTERVFSVPETTLPLLKSVRERGVMLAVDDFGVGYSSLSYLWQYPVDELKLDGSFLRAATQDPRARDLMMGLVPLADALDMALVAECVETEAEHVWLRDIGVNLQQGYYFARPAPIGEMLKLEPLLSF